MPSRAADNSWTGLFVGGHVGRVSTGSPTQSVADRFVDPKFVFGPSLYVPVSIGPGVSNDGLRGGFHGGVNWQVISHVVVGVDADWTAGRIGVGGSRALLVDPKVPGGGVSVPGADTSLRTQLGDIKSIRGRIGFAMPAWMAYLTAGRAWTDMNYTGDLTCPPAICGATLHAPVALNASRSGTVVGGGLEVKIANTPWIFGVEYLHYSFGGKSAATTQLVDQAGAPAGFALCLPGTCTTDYSFGGLTVQDVRLRLSYLWWPGR